jgi:hypothetical protein
MLHFHNTCPRHQEALIEAAKRGGCYDPAMMEVVRRKTLAWLSVKFPRMVLDHYNEKGCLGCKLEANRVDLKAIEGVIIELAEGRAPSEVLWKPTLY